MADLSQATRDALRNQAGFSGAMVNELQQMSVDTSGASTTGSISLSGSVAAGTSLSGATLSVGATPSNQLVFVNCEILAASISKSCFVATRPMTVKSIILRLTANDAGEVVDVYKAPSGTAIGSGTKLNLTQGDLSLTADTNQDLGVSATGSDLAIAAGDAIGLVFGGALDTATGVVTVALAYA